MAAELLQMGAAAIEAQSHCVSLGCLVTMLHDTQREVCTEAAQLLDQAEENEDMR